MTKKIFVFTLIFTFLFSGYTVYADSDIKYEDNKRWTIYNESNGLNSSEANDVAQTKDGFIWIATYSGLLRFDGKEFTYMKENHPELETDSIRELMVSKDNRLIIGTNDKGVYIYNHYQFNYLEREDEQYYSVRDIYETADADIFVSTTSGLAKIEENKLVDAGIKGIENKIFESITEDEYGNYWATDDEKNLYIFNDTNVLFTSAVNDSEQNKFTCVFKASNDHIFLGTTSNDIYEYILNSNNYDNNFYTKKVHSVNNLVNVTDIEECKHGEIWICADSQFGYFDNNMIYHPVECSMDAPCVEHMIEDYEGSLWFSSSKYGLINMQHGKYYNTNYLTDLFYHSVNAIYKTDDAVYIGTDSGLKIFNSSYEKIENSASKLLENTRIRCINEDSKGNIVISTYYDYGVVIYNPVTDEITSITEENGLLTNQVRCTLTLSNGDIAVATKKGFNIIRNNDIILSLDEHDGLPYSYILCMLELSDGTILLGSDGEGIYEIRNNELNRVIYKESGIKNGTILRMVKSPKSDDVFISAGTSAYIYSDRKIKEINISSFGQGSIFDFKFVDDKIWLIKGSEIIVLDVEDFSNGDMSKAKYIGKNSGLIGNIVANAWNYIDNEDLCLCTTNGVSHLKLCQDKFVAPKIAVSAVSIVTENETMVKEFPSKITIPADTKRLTIYCSALTFLKDGGRVEYYLEGFETKPIIKGNNSKIEAQYMNLPGGDYKFLFTAYNADGVKSEQDVSVIIHKEYKFTELWYFWLTIVLSFVAIVVGLAIFYIVRSRKRREEYRDITNQALMTIANTIDAKDKYTKGHSIHVAYYSRELAKKLGLDEHEQEKVYFTGLLHDIGKIGIPDAILNKPGKLSDEEMEIIRQHVEIGGSILKDFTAVEGIADGAHFHHERIDGKGYSHHLTGEEIPLIAKIIACADVYDAISTKRVYRDAMSKEEIIKVFQDGMGTQFDEKIGKIMLEMIKEGLEYPSN